MTATNLTGATNLAAGQTWRLAQRDAAGRTTTRDYLIVSAEPIAPGANSADDPDTRRAWLYYQSCPDAGPRIHIVSLRRYANGNTGQVPHEYFLAEDELVEVLP
jgi:hypothetical protein